MGCVQAKPSQGSPARSDLDRLKRDYAYVPSRHSDPLPPPPPMRREERRGAYERERSRREREKEKGGGGGVAEKEEVVVAPQPPLPRPERVVSGGREEEMVGGWPTWLLENVPREALRGIVPKSADAYDKIDKVGQGTYSNVYKARERDTGKIVALKKVRFDTSESESVRFMAREIRILRMLDHPNVIKLEGIATSRMHRSIYLVFEFMQSDLARVICRPGERLTEPQIKCYMQQLLSGLQHCHERRILHRDIKGSNLLIDRNGVLKIGDFGLANYVSPNRKRQLTSRVVTLWYRAPELLLGSTDYGAGIDLWSAGCLLAEMFAGRPIMPGRTEVEQLFKIFKLCGSPPDDYWRKMKLSASFRPPQPYKPTILETFRDLPSSSLGLLTTLLSLDPSGRGTAAEALQSEFFSTAPLACDLSSLPIISKEDVGDPIHSHDGRKPKLRQHSRKQRESKQKIEQATTEPNTNVETSNEEEKVTDPTKSSQGSDTAIATVSSSTIPKRSSVNPVEEISEGSPVPQEQLRRTATYHSASNDDLKDQPLVVLEEDSGLDGEHTSSTHHGLEKRSASMSDFRVRREKDLSKQYVLVD